MTDSVDTETSYLSLSDEDMDNLIEPATEEVPEVVEEEPSDEVVQDETETETPNEEEPEEEVEQEVPVESGEESLDTEATDVTEEAEEDSVEEPKEDLSTDLAKLYAPFNANGKQMQVDNVEDAITLMKMGANYNKKMAGLKPNIKLMKMLENNNLLDEAKLSYLIDLDKKTPEAVNKFIKESGVDPLEVDTEGSTEYKPNTYTVDDKEVELDTVLESLKDSPVFQDTIEIISNKWDESSKQVLVANPKIIEIINEHVSNGTYAKINSVIESERVLGRLTGLSDIEAYKQVGDTLQANGDFNTPESTVPAVAPSVPKKGVKDRKRAASSTKKAPAKNKQVDFNPLSLPDDEFDKLVEGKFL